MPLSSIVSSNPRGAPRRVRRAACVLALVLALHWLAALWLVPFHEPFRPVEPDHVPVQVELLKPQPIERAPAPEKPAADRPRAAPKRAARAPAPPAPPAPPPPAARAGCAARTSGQPFFHRPARFLCAGAIRRFLCNKFLLYVADGRF
ncbi:hypothetical protein AQ929_17645 [Burkholderia pseudomallei]|nr:hypothetical protein AQ929_17645 [Burkholderia pseudomallei]